MPRKELQLSSNNTYDVYVRNYGRGKQFEPKYAISKPKERPAAYPDHLSMNNVRELKELHELLTTLIREAEAKDKRHDPTRSKVPVKPLSDRFEEMEYD
jgi:hypothetical protein